MIIYKNTVFDIEFTECDSSFFYNFLVVTIDITTKISIMIVVMIMIITKTNSRKEMEEIYL